MCRTAITLMLTILFVSAGYSQKQKVTKTEKASLDSMMQKDEFMKMMDDDKGSTVDVSVGIGNGSFSSHNRAANATGETNLLIFTPSILYHHKSGFGIGATAYITSDSLNSGLYQTGIVGSYDYTGDEVDAGISYTRYISDMNKYNSRSIYQNDIYAYVKMAKGMIRPFLNLGFANGTNKEINVVVYTPPVGPSRLVRDTTNNSSSYFSLTVGAAHDFNLTNIFDKNDELDIVPAILLNSGSDKLTLNHNNILYAKIIQKSKRKRTTLTTDNQKFQLQSFGASLDCTYSVGKFFVQPSLYLDYFLPKTTLKKLTAIYNFTVGVSF